ncbi:MAG: DUF3352 domain-containing protein [Pirellulales bacterium]
MFSTSSPRPYRSILLSLGAVCLLAPAQLVQAARPSAAKLFPPNTVAYVSVASVPDLVERFKQSATGRMIQDPQLKPLIAQLYGSALQAAGEVQNQLGVTVPEILAVFQGEISVALVAPEKSTPALVVLVDAGDRVPTVRKLFELLLARLGQEGAAKKEETISGTKVTISDVPNQEDQKIVYFEKDGTVALSTNVEVVKTLLAVWNGEKKDTLSENDKYAAIMSRCRGARNESPQIAWFADPIGIARAFGQGNPAAQIGLAVLPTLGLDGLSGVGGTVTLVTGQFDSISHIHLLLDSPRGGIIEMLALGTGDTTPETWVPGDVSSYTTIHWKVDTTYRKLGTLIDSFQGEGAFKSRVQEQMLRNTGVDLEKEILPALDGRFTLVTSFERPVTIQSGSNMVGIRLKDGKEFQKVVDKVVARFKDVILQKSSGGKVYYQFQPPRMADMPPAERPPMPCFAILGNYLLVSNQLGVLERAIAAEADPTKGLADAPDFKLMASKISKQAGGTKPGMISFSRPEESLRFFYELAVSDRTRESLKKQAENNPFFRTLNQALESNPLPPFEVLAKYFAPEGGVLVDDETGFHYTAFSLRRE